MAAWATWPPWHGTRLQGLLSIPGQTQTRPSVLDVTHRMGHKKIMGHYGAVLVDTWWNWVSMGRYWLVHGGTGSV